MYMKRQAWLWFPSEQSHLFRRPKRLQEPQLPTKHQMELSDSRPLWKQNYHCSNNTMLSWINLVQLTLIQIRLHHALFYLESCQCQDPLREKMRPVIEPSPELARKAIQWVLGGSRNPPTLILKRVLGTSVLSARTSYKESVGVPGSLHIPEF